MEKKNIEKKNKEIKKLNRELKKLKNVSHSKKGGAIKLTDFVSTKDTECADFLGKKEGEPCSSCTIVDAIVQYTDTIIPNMSNSEKFDKTSKLPDQIKLAANVLNCDTEMCVVSHPQFKKFVLRNHIINRRDLESEIEHNFKVKGPRDNTKWLNNEDIDDNLNQWAITFPQFFPCPFAMIDFDKMGEPLHRYNLSDIYKGKHRAFGKEKRECDTFACAINTDKHTGGGQHWMALFVDMRGKNGEPWTVEFFNSTGSPPAQSIVNWMVRTSEYLKQFRSNNTNNANNTISGPVDVIYVTNIQHQRSKTECGMYTLFYIRSRLEGKSYQLFLSGERVSDDAMIEFRKHCFR